ncbi:antibiotic biosynthesis monooxygenase [Streptomyces sp. NPDC003077]|uniref:antibiotic biosynthesis monooxygenase n=1 Tax=Streptomyces sp. NPDC003077 TaxID=3154443 RepID=UPI0033AE0948
MPPAPFSPTAPFPDVRRPDAGTVLLSRWIVPAPEFQRPAADAVQDEWEAQERPDAMLSLTAFLSLDGTHVLNYAQWRDDDAHREWVRTRRPAAIDRIDRDLPPIERPGVWRGTVYRSYVADAASDGGGAPRPGLLVTPTFATTGPAAQRALADAVVETLARERVPGLLGAHFHLAKDGGSVLNHAEWTGHEAWRAFAAGPVSRRLAAEIEALGPDVTPTWGALPPAAPPNGRAEIPRYVPYRAVVNVPAPGGDLG